MTCGYIYTLLNAPAFIGFMLSLCIASVAYVGYHDIPGKTSLMVFLSTCVLFLFGIFCRLLCGIQEKKTNSYERLASDDFIDEMVML